MNRRDFLKLLALLAVSTYLGSSTSAKKDRIVLVGAGIIGCALGYELAKAGANVTLIDKAQPGSQASGNSFSWINATYPKQPYVYNFFSQLGIDAYKSLTPELGLNVKWSGSLEWFADKQIETDSFKQLAHIMEYKQYTPVEIISASAANQLEPKVIFEKNTKVIFSKSDGAIDAGDAINKFTNQIKQYGGKVIYPCEYRSSNYKNGKLLSVKTNQGEIEADKVIFTAGIDTNALTGQSFLKEATPGIIIKSKPSKDVMNRMLIGPGIHLHQKNDGVVVIGEQTGAPENHKERLKDKPNNFPETIGRQHGERLLQQTNLLFEEKLNLDLDQISIGWRPLPKDGMPIIGWLPNRPNSYIATMHSGVSLAAIVAKVASQEILDGVSNTLLKEFRPSRFF